MSAPSPTAPSPLGLNRRNLEFVDACNPVRFRHAVDHKITAKRRLAEAGLPVPETYAQVEYQHQLRRALEQIAQRPSFVLKPACGTQGQGVMVITGREGGRLVRANGRKVSMEEFRFEICAVLSGIYSKACITDHALIEERLLEHPDLVDVHGTEGVSDLRVIVHRGRPAMAMLRLPCRASGAVANLHAGGIGVGMDLDTGRTTFAIRNERPVDRHPDTGVALRGVVVPCPTEFIERLGAINDLFSMDYLGVDVVLDRTRGPVILEVNARPGLAIQLANRRSLLEVIPHNNDGR